MTSDLVVYGISSVGLQAFFYQVTSGNVGTWTTASGTVTLNSWNHIVFTHDTSESHLTDPIIYINGVEKTLTETSTPTGVIPIDNFNATLFGNALGHVTPFYGYIKDPRVYNSILALSNVVELYNGGVQDYSIGTYGLMFQGFFVSADVGDATSLDGSLLVTPKFAIDNVFHTIGRGAGLGQIRIDAP